MRLMWLLGILNGLSVEVPTSRSRVHHERPVASVAVLAEIPLRSPQKLFTFIIKKNICWVKVRHVISE